MTIYIKGDRNHGICDTTGYVTDSHNNSFFSFGIKGQIMKQITSPSTFQLHIIESKDLDMFRTESATLQNFEGTILSPASALRGCVAPHHDVTMTS